MKKKKKKKWIVIYYKASTSVYHHGQSIDLKLLIYYHTYHIKFWIFWN